MMMTVIDNILNKLVDFIGDLFFAILIIVIGFKMVNIIVNKIKYGKRFSTIEKSNQSCRLYPALISLLTIKNVYLPYDV